MIHSVGSVNRLAPYAQYPFGQLSNQQPYGGMWPKASSNPFEQITKNAATGIANFLKSAQSVQSAASNLLQKNSTAFQARTASSSDPKSVAVTAANSASANTYRVQVDAVATVQVNTGDSLNAADNSSIQGGNNQFTITIGGKSTDISAFILSSDTNEQAMTKLQTAINNAKTGVTASIVTDKATGTAKLALTSDKTGESGQFSISDKSGNAVAAAGIGAVSQNAANASYRVNGGTVQSSQSNTIELEKGKVSATLLRATTEAATIQVAPDADNTVSLVKELIGSYNTMLSRADEAGGYLNPAIARRLDNTISSSAYAHIGIRKSADGSLQVDENKLKASLRDNYDRTVNAIAGSAGLASTLNKSAARFNDVSASSLLNRQMQSMQQFAAYQASMQSYSQLPMSGWLLNGFM